MLLVRSHGISCRVMGTFSRIICPGIILWQGRVLLWMWVAAGELNFQKWYHKRSFAWYDCSTLQQNACLIAKKCYYHPSNIRVTLQKQFRVAYARRTHTWQQWPMLLGIIWLFCGVLITIHYIFLQTDSTMSNIANRLFVGFCLAFVILPDKAAEVLAQNYIRE